MTLCKRFHSCSFKRLNGICFYEIWKKRHVFTHPYLNTLGKLPNQFCYLSVYLFGFCGESIEYFHCWSKGNALNSLPIFDNILHNSYNNNQMGENIALDQSTTHPIESLMYLPAAFIPISLHWFLGISWDGTSLFLS